MEQYAIFGYLLKITHIFGAIVWLGGALFMSGIAQPIQKYYSEEEHSQPMVVSAIHMIGKRFAGLNWMALFCLLLSGILISILHNGFKLFRLQSLFDWTIHLKILLFIPACFLNYALSASHRELEKAREERTKDEDLSPKEIAEWRIIMLRRVNTYLAFALLALIGLL